MQTIGQIIATNRKKQGMTQAQLSAELEKFGVRSGFKSISNWEKDVSSPPIETFLAICRILGIRDVLAAYYGINPLSPESALNEEGMQKVQEYVKVLLLSHLYDKPKSEIISLPPRQIKLFRIMASAGTGNFLDGEDYEWIEAESNVPDTADFGVQLSGDSMEPRFVNRQIVWVHRQETLEFGEIGIFYLNGNAYCKKYIADSDGISLFSLNPKYAPIHVDPSDSFKIFGKVI